MAASKDSMNHTSILFNLSDHLYRHLNTSNKMSVDIAQLAKQRTAIGSLLGYYLVQLGSMNPVMFNFLKPAQREQVEKQLMFTLYLLAAQTHLDDAEDRTKNLPSSIDGINLCLKRLGELKKATIPDEDEREKQLAEARQSSEMYLKYLGLTILAPWLVSRMTEFAFNEKKASEQEGKTSEKPDDSPANHPYSMAIKKQYSDAIAPGKKTTLLVEWMSLVNFRRLYWVWGGGMLASALDLMAFQGTLPIDQIDQAQQHLSIPSPAMGYMSWVLYYTRFGISLGLLLKHTIAGPWMSDKEANIPAWERFKTQWNQRKFALLNDAIWATANLVCFFWLRGSGMLGYAGNVVTACLLLMDLSLSIWRFVEESTKHNQEMAAFIEREKELTKQIELLAGSVSGIKKSLEQFRAKIVNFDEDEDVKKLKQQQEQYLHQQAVLEAERKQLQKTKKQAEMAWRYKKYGLINDTAYAAGLLFAFCLFCCFFFPPAALAPALVLIMGVAGAALCFTLTVLYAAVSGGLDIAKSKESIKDARAECKELMVQFANESDPDIKKQLYLEMKALMAESEYQEKMIRFQAIQLARSIFVDAFIPALVFASLVFMPLGIGLAVMAAGFAVAVISHIIINRFKPENKAAEDLQKLSLITVESDFKKFQDNFNKEFAEAPKEISDKQLLAFFKEPKVESEVKESKKSLCFPFFKDCSKEGYQKLPEETGNDFDPGTEIPGNVATK
ncbi:hypothetical protein [Legionella clemsonensis]|uniref:Coiled-coil protein n=1 Tax=Legionella clemsonensis TaxID=1867846 RepID=A0A222P6C4_9GAMM|nr:hypothetical protein [Legionella clemsonensis]ASQ47382.1 hypothetical protein clem_14280 [Legionella clemsonensis]